MRRLPADPAPVPVGDDTEPSAPRVSDDMTVEVALSVMAGARVDHLLLCDGDDQCTGLVTRARLTVLRDSSTYTDRIRLRDVPGGALPSPRPAPAPAPSVPLRSL
ncbi:CBS domain-containing protein [Streptomyces aurantiogriseus]|uniref:CBS domain-containing protein n=1 Tax=Streptomyces aurantiogriseus TaxID=66870 RepID=A0A918BTR1_9ACTN|nr:CBS domain-containing protein [Streptomyces aurantiogriseus]GGQ91592.1 hypothetical protein GCM10010251_02570 [Streptomyces aurantiogriseus]